MMSMGTPILHNMKVQGPVSLCKQDIYFQIIRYGLLEFSLTVVVMVVSAAAYGTNS